MMSPLSPSPLPPVRADGILRVLPLPDLHLPAKPASARRLLDDRVFLDRMDYVLLLGDAVRAYGTPREYAAVARFLEELKRPFGAVTGNHESWFALLNEDDPNYSMTWEAAAPQEEEAALRRFRAFYNYESLWRAEHNALGCWVFLSLDGIGLWKQETLSAPQQAFLLEQIHEAGRAPLYIFCHAPLMLDRPLDLVYYEAERSGCLELTGEIARALTERRGPTLWMSGHIHLRPDHYLFAPYEVAPGVWQVHCPDGWGYSRWTREQHVPQFHENSFTRHLEASHSGVDLITWEHGAQREIARHRITF